jgi:hypothetical protein
MAGTGGSALAATVDAEPVPYPPVPLIRDALKYPEPKSVAQARASPYRGYWEDAMRSELRSLDQHKTWEVVDRPSDRTKKILPCHWVYRVKTDKDNQPEKFKARLVAGGNRQREGHDYFDTYAPVIGYATLRILLTIAAVLGWIVKQIDIKTAFLNGDLNEELYMFLPPGFHQGLNKVVRLLKSLYGLKQSPRMWYLKLKGLLNSIGFRDSPYDNALWIHDSGPHVVIMCTLVDDMLITSENPTYTQYMVDRILAVFEGTQSADCSMYGGIRINWIPNEHAVHLSQEAHIMDLVKKVQPKGVQWHPRSLPVKPGLRFHKNGTSDNWDSPPLNTGLFDYRSLIGTLTYITTCTRPDIAFVVNQLAKYSHAPTQAHWDVAVGVVQYLLGTATWGIKLGHHIVMYDAQGSPQSILAYTDSEFGTGIDDKRPASGRVSLLHGGCVMWKSHSQKLVSDSTTTAELREMGCTAKDAQWLQHIMPIFSVPASKFPILGDNKAAVDSVRSLAPTQHTKHLELAVATMRQLFARGVLDFQLVPGDSNPADIFTKSLKEPEFRKFRHMLAVVPSA